MIKFTFQYIKGSELLYVLSTMLYHSTDYFVKFKSGQQTESIIFYFQNGFSDQTFQILIILAFLLIVVILGFYYIFLKKQCYLIQILDRLMFPIQMIGLVRFLNQQKNNNQNFKIVDKVINVAFYLVIIFTLIIIVIKKYRFNFRYYNNLQQYSFTQIGYINKFLQLAKLLITFVFSTCLPNYTITYIFCLSIINIFINLNYYINIIYENPNIQYLSFLTQIYIWIPVLSVYLYQFSQSSHSSTFYSINLITILTYIFFTIFKLQIITVSVLERKYVQCLIEFKSLINHKVDEKFQGNEKLFKIVISVILQIFCKQNSSCDGLGNLRWSQNFKHQLLKTLQQINKQTTILQVNRQHELKLKLNQNQDQQQQMNSYICFDYKFLDKLIKNLKVGQQFSQKFSNIIWNYVYESQMMLTMNGQERVGSVRRLGYFLCYKMPDVSQLMKQRLFYLFYIDRQTIEEHQYFNLFESKLCYNHLRQKIIGNKIINTKLNIGINCNLKISDPFSYQFPLQNHQYNEKYNQIFQQNDIFYNIMNKFQQFQKNQQFFMQIQQNIDHFKQKILNYHERRNSLRKNIQKLISEYEELNDKKKYCLLYFKYLKEKYLDQNPLIANRNLFKSLQTNIKSGKNSLSSKKNNKLLINSKNINQQSIYQKPTCIISGIKHPGKIQISSTFFNNLFQSSNPKSVQKFSQSHQNDINQIILHLFRQPHQQIISNINETLQTSLNHFQPNKYFMISLKRSFVYEIKMKIYFYFKYEEDFMMVVDFEQIKVLKNLQIRDSNHKLLFEYDNVDGINSINMEKRSMDKMDRFQDVRIFNHDYWVFKEVQEEKLESKSQVFEENQKSGTMKNTKSQRWLENDNANKQCKHKYELNQFYCPKSKQISKQIHFNTYKHNFSYQPVCGYLKILLNLLFTITFPLSLYYLITYQQSLQQRMLKLIIIKNQLHQNYIITQTKWKVYYKIFNVINLMQTQGIDLKKVQIFKNSIFQRIQLQHLQLRKQLRNDVRLQKIAESQRYAKVLFQYKNEFKGDQSARISYQMDHLYEKLKFFQQYQNKQKIEEYSGNKIGISFEEFFVLKKKLLNILLQEFKFMKNRRSFIAFLIYLINLIILLCLMLVTLYIEISISKNYNYSLNTSFSFQNFMIKNTQNLKQIIQKLYQTQQNQSLSYTKAIKNYQYQESKSFKPTLNKQQIKLVKFSSPKNNKLSIRKLVTVSIFQSFIRFFVVSIAIYTIWMINNMKVKKLQIFQEGVNTLQLIQVQMIEQTYVLFDLKKNQQTVLSNTYENPNANYLQQQDLFFDVQQLRYLNKWHLMKQIFPYSQQSQIYSSYPSSKNQSQSKSVHQNQLEQNSKINYKDFLMILSRFSKQLSSCKWYVKEFLSHRIDSNKFFDHLEMKVGQVFYDYNAILKKSADTIDFGIIQMQRLGFVQYSPLIQMIMFLAVIYASLCFLFRFSYLNLTLKTFSEQFLLIAPYHQLHKQQGYQYFTNRSSQHIKC